MISVGSAVSTGAIQAGADPRVAHAAGAMANIVSQNYVGAVMEVAQLAGHVLGILGSGDEGIPLQLTGEQLQAWMINEPVPGLTPEQLNVITGAMDEPELDAWLATKRASALSPEQVAGLKSAKAAEYSGPPPVGKANWNQIDFRKHLVWQQMALTPADVAAQKGVPVAPAPETVLPAAPAPVGLAAHWIAQAAKLDAAAPAAHSPIIIAAAPAAEPPPESVAGQLDMSFASMGA
jgi:hypothetical protein